MKKIFFLSVIVTAILTISSIVFADNNAVTVKINQIPQSFPDDSMPFISDEGRTMVPVRFISERFGAKVTWNSGVVEILEEQVKRVILKVGEKWSIINVFGGADTKKELDATVMLKDGRTFVPLRFVSESLDAKVDWDATSRTVSIVSDKVKKDTSRIYDRLNSTGEYELKYNSTTKEFYEDKNLGWAVSVPKDKNAKFEITRSEPSVTADGKGYIQQDDIDITIISYDVYTRHKIRELLKQIFPTQSAKAYDYLMLALREEIWEVPKSEYFAIFPGIGDIYLDNRSFRLVNNTNNLVTVIDIGLDGYFNTKIGSISEYNWAPGAIGGSTLKQRDYELYKQWNLDQY